MTGLREDSVGLPREIATAALEALPHGVVVSSAIAPDRRVIYANEAFTRLTGLPREEVLGRSAFFARGLCADDAPAAAAIEAAMGLGRAFQGEVSSRRKDGAALSCELTLAPLRDAAGLITHWVGTLVDVTARRAAEEAAHQSEQRLRSLGDHLPNGAICRHTRSPDGTVTFTHMSAGIERILGVTPAEAEADPAAVYGLVEPEDMPRVRAAEEKALREMAPLDCEFRMRSRDGRVRWIHASSAPRPGAGGEVFWDGYILDETERKLVLERLRRSEKMDAIGRLSGGVAHDFNNVLTVIHTCAELLRREESRPETVERRKRLHDEISSAAKRAGALTRQLLAFSRKQVQEPAVIDLGRTVLGLEATLRRLISEDIELVTRADPKAGLVRADAGQIEQIVVNLVVNARDAIPGGGRIEISVRPVDLEATWPPPGEGKPLPEPLRLKAPRGSPAQAAASPRAYVELLVADSGTGLDADAITHVFEPFYTTKGEEHGTGLGLATVHAIVQQSGGAIDVESAPGRGAAFRILLPRLEGAGTPDTPRPAVKEREVLGAAGARILVVEDDEAVRRPTVDLLERSGYAVVEAADGEDALRTSGALEGKVDLLLTDVIMPRMGGPELARRLLELRPGIRVLYTSGYAPDDALRGRIAQDGLAFLAKPFTADQLVNAVREALARPPGG